MRSAVLTIAMIALAGCETPPHRDQRVDNPGVVAAVAFLHAAGASRATVEARLGPPPETFERGQVVAYVIYLERLPERAQPRFGNRYISELKSGTPWGRKSWQLMIEYDNDGNVLRHNLLLR